MLQIEIERVLFGMGLGCRETNRGGFGSRRMTTVRFCRGKRQVTGAVLLCVVLSITNRKEPMSQDGSVACCGRASRYGRFL